MPIYGYRCEQCGHELEVLQTMSEEPLKVCPNCMGPLYKMVYPAGIIFKGSGYYTTDYKNAKSSNAGSSSSREGGSSEATGSDSGSGGESKSESKTESSSESKSESKADAKSESKPAKAAEKPSAATKRSTD